jgi:hypothetical protein
MSTRFIISVMAAMAFVLPLTAQSVRVIQYPANGCPAVAATAERLIESYPHPASWRFIVACDESAWDHLAKIAAPGENPDTVFGTTEQKVSLTILRGSRMTNQRPGEPTPDHIVSHELAHVFLRTSDDIAVDRLSKRWMESRGIYDATAGN